MITAINKDNMSAYKALFAEAADLLCGYKRVRTFEKDLYTYYKKDHGAISFEDMFIEITGIDTLDKFATTLAENGVLYKKIKDNPEPGFNPISGITTLEEYFSWIRNLGDVDRKYTILPLDEAHFEINANTRAIQVPNEFKRNGIAVQGDDLAEVVYFKIDRYFDYMDFNNTEIFIQWETPRANGQESVKSVSQVYVRDIESEPGKLIFGWALSDAITKVPGDLKFSVRFFEWADDEHTSIDYSFSTLTATCKILPSIGIDPESDDLVIDDCGDRLIGRLENSTVAGGYAAAKPEFSEDLPTEELDIETDSVLSVQAYSADTGSITYRWKRQELTPDNVPEGAITTLTGELAYKEILAENYDTELDPKLTYYKFQDGHYVYQPTIPPTAEEIGQGVDKLYLPISSLTVDNYGMYWALAENRITNSASFAESNKVMFPRPEAINIVNQPNPKGILDGDCQLVVAADNIDGVLSYQWYYDDNKALNFGEATPDWAEIPGAINSSYNATEEGHYKVKVINTRNNDSKEEFSEFSRVTMPAVEPTIADALSSTKIYSESALNDENCFTVTLQGGIDSDEYTVAWYLFEENSPKLIVEGIKVDGLQTKFNPKNYAERIIEISSDNDLDGAYYPIVTNHLNGSTASTDALTNIDEMFLVTL